MKNLLPFVALLAIPTVNSVELLKNLRDYQSTSEVYRRFTSGDVINCVISNFISVATGAEHVMLATSPTTVAHIRVTGDRAIVMEEEYWTVIRDKGYSSCRIANNEYDNKMLEKGITPLSIDRQIEKAEGWVGSDEYYYNIGGCNCQHWVTEWRYGKAWSIQANQPPNSRCVLSNRFTSGGNSKAIAAPGRASVHASTGETYSGASILSTETRGPTVGANAEATLDRLGAGFEATYGESRVNLGNQVGVSVGIRTDTGIGIGRDGAQLEVLGTGFRFSRSRGSRLCILGGCVHFG